MRRKFVSVFFIVWVLFAMPTMVFAQQFDAGRLGSVSVTLMNNEEETPIVGAELSLYCVASAELNGNHHLSYSFVNAFAECDCTLDDPELSVTLDAFVKERSVSAEKRITDANGKASFTNLPLGLYLIKQTNTVTGYAPCTSFLVTVPAQKADGYVYDVDATPKTEVEKLTDITVKKVWNTDASAKAADHVTVQLLRDGAVVETAMLSDQNDWQVSYTDMPASDAYSVVEVNIPKGFTATYSKNGYVFTVTNTASLIQTGQLFWPIPVLAMIGLCLIAVGAVVLRRENEE